MHAQPFLPFGGVFALTRPLFALTLSERLPRVLTKAVTELLYVHRTRALTNPKAFNDEMHWRAHLTRSQRQGVSYAQGLKTADGLAGSRASQQPLLTLSCQKDFLLACWHLQLAAAGYEAELHKYQSYLRHYQESCTYIHTAYSSLEDCTHEHFCQAVQELRQGTRLSCEANIQNLMPQTARNSTTARDCVNFLGRAVLLMDLHQWGANESLTDFVARSIASGSTQKDQYRIPLSFNARAFEKVAGIRIVWTRDLLSHLETGSDYSTVAIFHHMKVLGLYEQSILKDVFPDGFFDETRRTVSIMLPVADKKCMKWFRSKQSDSGLDISVGDCRHLRATQRNIQNFNYWRDRLINVKEAFELSQPKGLVSFWRDDRNKVQWWTFWIAIVVFVLTLIGVLEGALQVYKAYHPSP